MFLRLSVIIICFVARTCAGLPQGPPTIISSVTTVLPIYIKRSGPQCGDCYVVGDRINVVFGTVFSDSVRSIILGLTPFTFGPTGLINTKPAPATPSTAPGLSTILIISGLTITSPTAYNVFTAFSITSTVAVNGQCSVIAGLPIQVNPQSYIVPQGVAQADFALSAEQAFISNVGLPICSPGGGNPDGAISGHTQQYTPTAGAIPYITLTAYVTVTASVNNSTPLATSVVPGGGTLESIASPTSAILTNFVTPTSQPLALQSSSSSSASPVLTAGVKVGIGVAIPVGIIGLSMLATYLWRKDQRQRRGALKAEEVPKAPDDTSQWFVQQKPELDAEQRRHEMEANERIHQLVPGSRRHELSADDRRQELKGEDHSQELEVPTE